MTGGTKIPAFAGESQKIFVLTLPTFDPGKTLGKVPAVKELLNNFTDNGATETVAFLIFFWIER